LPLKLYNIEPGLAGTDQTVQKLIDFIKSAQVETAVREIAVSILNTSGVDSWDPEGVARSIYSWVSRNVAYISDPVGAEYVQDPLTTVNLGAGDCDDHAALVGALALAVGLPARLAVVGNDQNSFDHIFPELLVSGSWVPCDTTSPYGYGQKFEFPSIKYYSLEGDVMPSFLSDSSERLKETAYRAAWNKLTRLWNSGQIDYSTLLGYLEAIDAGESPFAGTFADLAMRDALMAFMAAVDDDTSMEVDNVNTDHFQDVVSAVRHETESAFREIESKIAPGAVEDGPSAPSLVPSIASSSEIIEPVVYTDSSYLVYGSDSSLVSLDDADYEDDLLLAETGQNTVTEKSDNTGLLILGATILAKILT